MVSLSTIRENAMTDETCEHVKTVARLLRNTAKDKNVTKFDSILNSRLFALVLPHCHPKVQRRLKDLKERLTKTKDSNDIILSTYKDLLSRYKSLETDPEGKKNSTSNAEREAARFSKINSMFDGLHRCKRSLHAEVTTSNLSDISLENFITFAAHTYIIGHSEINLEVAATCPKLVPIMRACQKVGNNFRCSTRLFRSLSELVVVPRNGSSIEKQVIELNYWHVLKCVWWQRRGTFVPITR